MDRREAAQILGISENATADEAKTAFKKKAAKLHPDVNKSPTAEDDFKKANQACQIFEKNLNYNMHTSGFSTQGFTDFQSMFDNMFAGQQNSSGQSFNFNFGGPFRPTSGARGKSSQAKPPSIIRKRISFIEAVTGFTLKEKHNVTKQCNKCNGIGVEVLHTGDTCETCNGAGFIKDGYLDSLKSRCTKCSGFGKKPIQVSCTKCSGKRTYLDEIEFSVNLGPGISNGDSFTTIIGVDRINIIIEIEPDPDMTMLGEDIHSSIEISLLESFEGTSKEVRTVGGTRKLKLKSRTMNGDKIVADGLGVPPDGRHVFTVKVELPENLEPLIGALKNA